MKISNEFEPFSPKTPTNRKTKMQNSKKMLSVRNFTKIENNLEVFTNSKAFNTNNSTEKKFVEVFHRKSKTPHYRGETLNNLHHGKGELYHKNGTLEYKGDFQFGGPHGIKCT